VGLVMALLTLLLLSLLGAALLTATTVDSRIGDNYQTAAQLLYLADSGIEDGREALSLGMIAPSATPFIKDRQLRDPSGRTLGMYSVSLIRSSPLTLQSTATIGFARKTIEARLMKSGFPTPQNAITLSEGAPNDGVDLRLKTPVGAERFVEGIRRNATDTFESASLGAVGSSIGSSAEYRVVVVNGNCEFGGAAGYGILLVRGELTLRGNFTWNGLILVIGQGTMRFSGSTTGWISGAVFLSRTKNVDGTLLGQLGTPTLDLSGNKLSVDFSAAEIGRANQRFPYVAVSYREF
jgi:hypothetical protein